jgi:light-regulated signal transduction histidine kinase (bacteriophytochrome)
MGSKESPVSMFTGRSDHPPPSPTWSQKSGGHGAILSTGSVDRVFPIRSAVSIDPTATPLPRGETGDGFPGMRLLSDAGTAGRRSTSRDRDRRRFSRSSTDRNPSPRRSGSPKHWRPSFPTPLQGSDSTVVEGRKPSASAAPLANTLDHNHLASVMSDAASARSDQASASISESNSKEPSLLNEEGIITARFKHVVSDGGHAVITGRDGDTLQRCEDEPIHIPGAVQSFGVLLAFREDNGKLDVRVASENSASILGYSPAQLFKLDNFLDIFTEEQADNLLDHLDFIRDENAADVEANGPEVFMISVRPPQHRIRKLWCAMHISDSDKDLVVCEFEVEDDLVNPLVPADDDLPEPRESSLGSNPTAQEFAESTVNHSRPLRVLRSARKKRGEAAAMEVFNIMSQVQQQMASAPDLQTFLKVLIGVVKELSGFHRVMIYQFDHTWNGRVVAELVDPRATKDLYKGLHFPASDIPRQARDLYKVNKVRLLYDRDQETSRLVCRTMDDLEKPVDMTHAYLRAMSPIHLKYLGNMGVRSSMSISITTFDQLWGLIACHSYGTKGMRVSFPIRKMCRLVGDTASRHIERLSYASRLQARKLINTAPSAGNPSGYIVASSEDLMNLFDAEVGALSIHDETKVMGNIQGQLQEILAVVEYLRLRRPNAVMTSQDITMDFPDFKYAPGLNHIAGLLYVPLSQGGRDFIVFFRRGVLQEVKWAGNPYEKFVKEGTEGYLEPRKSFKVWSETIVGRCRDWTEEQVETASVLCLVYGKFIEVWRQKEVALQNSQLTRLLLANSAHEVRTPLNHIINYLEIALEGTLDQDTRENLARSHSASKSLVYVINDLLDLTKAESSKDLVKEEPFDLHEALREAIDTFSGDAKRKGIDYRVNISPQTPSRVVGDQRRVRQVVSNLISNAIEHTSAGSVNVEALPGPESASDRHEIEIVVEDTGAGMSQAKVDALFRELEEVSCTLEIAETRMLEQHPSDSKKSDHTTLGLGLAVVARTIRAMNGQLRLKTEEGQGSRFVVQLGLGIDRQTDEQKAVEATTDSGSATASPSKGSHSSHVRGEVTLIDRNTSSRAGSIAPRMVRRISGDSTHSLQSQRSGRSQSSLLSNASGKSDADRLIDAIQEPLRLVGDTGETQPEKRSKLSLQHPRGFTTDNALDSSPNDLPQRARSLGSSRETKSAFRHVPGEMQITDSAVPMKALRVPEESLENPRDKLRKGNSVVFEEPERITASSQPQPDRVSANGSYRILVAEDDPINSKIMKKRLEKLGHSVHMTINGEECSSAHGEEASSFDAVLMDLQV